MVWSEKASEHISWWTKWQPTNLPMEKILGKAFDGEIGGLVERSLARLVG